jgi:hypothetical protein
MNEVMVTYGVTKKDPLHTTGALGQEDWQIRSSRDMNDLRLETVRQLYVVHLIPLYDVLTLLVLDFLLKGAAMFDDMGTGEMITKVKDQCNRHVK